MVSLVKQIKSTEYNKYSNLNWAAAYTLAKDWSNEEWDNYLAWVNAS